MTDRTYVYKIEIEIVIFVFIRTKQQRIIPSGCTWDCSLCTYKNPSVAFRCEMCDSSKGTATR
jgi:hypothetical protein